MLEGFWILPSQGSWEICSSGGECCGEDNEGEPWGSGIDLLEISVINGWSRRRSRINSSFCGGSNFYRVSCPRGCGLLTQWVGWASCPASSPGWPESSLKVSETGENFLGFLWERPWEEPQPLLLVVRRKGNENVWENRSSYTEK